MTTTVLCIDNRRNAAIFNLQLIAILTNGVFISNTTSFQLAETVAALAVLTTLEIAGIVCGILLLLVMAVCAVYVYRKIHLNHQINQPLSTRKLYVDDIPLVEAQETAINFSLFSHRARSNNVSLEPIKESGEDIGPTEYGSDDNDIDENSDSFDTPPEVVEEIIAPVSSNRNSQPPSRSASIGSKLSKKSVNFNEEIRGNVTVTTVEMNGELYEIHEGEFSFDPNCSNGDDNIVGRPRNIVNAIIITYPRRYIIIFAKADIKSSRATFFFSGSDITISTTITDYAINTTATLSISIIATLPLSESPSSNNKTVETTSESPTESTDSALSSAPLLQHQSASE
ncbi:uncharacterized protein TRIADDRAFT_57052 [Trichoplax adhaerens]|uniref:Uncharacterized protein n=1 Tax=Trichoplax adhaerens TaxID=10228 RepID=B3S0H6_TRIAD|nr:predicted protein [Trichoplax adhaerens]EDV23644.1 predicted protein [Trichoplax adhaerens]|eukprot:XP_002113170.1 predicted protein [Trichoplax adhaerens]